MPTTPPRAAARAAFDKLDTTEKTSFILEATFNTIGQALEETGRRVADVVESFDLDDLFTADSVEDPVDARPPKAAPRKKPSPRAKTTPPPKTAPPKTPPSKTAGKTKPTDPEA